jgi:hypothetical protein
VTANKAALTNVAPAQNVERERQTKTKTIKRQAIKRRYIAMRKAMQLWVLTR